MSETVLRFCSSHVHNHKLVSLRPFAEHEIIDFNVIIYNALVVKELNDSDLAEIRSNELTLCAATAHTICWGSAPPH